MPGQPIYPLPIIPNMTSPRVTAHLGRFTLHPFNEGGLERFAEETFRSDKIPYLVKIEIPSSCHVDIFRSLRSAGIADLNFTQDLDGIAKELGLRIRIGKYDHNKNIDTFQNE